MSKKRMAKTLNLVWIAFFSFILGQNSEHSVEHLGRGYPSFSLFGLALIGFIVLREIWVPDTTPGALDATPCQH
jgi:hypothetical protein